MRRCGEGGLARAKCAILFGAFLRALSHKASISPVCGCVFAATRPRTHFVCMPRRERERERERVGFPLRCGVVVVVVCACEGRFAFVVDRERTKVDRIPQARSRR